MTKRFDIYIIGIPNVLEKCSKIQWKKSFPEIKKKTMDSMDMCFLISRKK